MSTDGGQIDAWERARNDRIQEFFELGIVAQRGQCLGEIQFSAKEADKILRALRRLKKTEQQPDPDSPLWGEQHKEP